MALGAVLFLAVAFRSCVMCICLSHYFKSRSYNINKSIMNTVFTIKVSKTF